MTTARLKVNTHSVGHIRGTGKAVPLYQQRVMAQVAFRVRRHPIRVVVHSILLVLAFWTAARLRVILKVLLQGANRHGAYLYRLAALARPTSPTPRPKARSHKPNLTAVSDVIHAGARNVNTYVTSLATP